MEALSDNISTILSELSTAQAQPFIFKLHNHLRNINSEAYEPQVVSIGPYHHGKDNLRMMERQKLRYLDAVIQRSNRNIQDFVSTVAELEKKARDCYAEQIGFNVDEFTKMLLVDGCFIIELLRIFDTEQRSSATDPVFDINWIFTSVQRDILLFENQIPFFVLGRLFDQIEGPNKQSTLIKRVIAFFGALGAPGVLPTNWSNCVQDGKHVLDLVHANWRYSSGDGVYVSVYECSPERMGRLIPTATELVNAGVKFQKKKGGGILFDVEFENGIMLMPPLTIDDGTECIFRNFIAHEQYFSQNQPNFVTDYLTLLDCLINSAGDVEILSRSGIINNWMSDNEVAANTVNQLTEMIVCPHDHFVYGEMFPRINAHSKKPWNRAWAVLKRDYFNTPWAYFKFLGALLVLLLGVAQAVFTALQFFGNGTKKMS